MSSGLGTQARRLRRKNRDVGESKPGAKKNRMSSKKKRLLRFQKSVPSEPEPRVAINVSDNGGTGYFTLDSDGEPLEDIDNDDCLDHSSSETEAEHAQHLLAEHLFGYVWRPQPPPEPPPVGEPVDLGAEEGSDVIVDVAGCDESSDERNLDPIPMQLGPPSPEQTPCRHLDYFDQNVTLPATRPRMMTEQYIAKSATPTKSGHGSLPRGQDKKEIDNLKHKLRVQSQRADYYRDLALRRKTENERDYALRRSLLGDELFRPSVLEPGNEELCPNEDEYSPPYQVPTPEEDARDLKKLVEATVAGNIGGTSQVHGRKIATALSALGLDGQGRQTKQTKVDLLVHGIRTLTNFAFGEKIRKGGDDEIEVADILGKALVEGEILSKRSQQHIAFEIAKSANSNVFTPVKFLESMDTLSASMNDTCVNAFADIERKNPHTDSGRGQSWIPLRWRLAAVRAICNKVVKEVFGMIHNPGGDESKHGDFVAFDYEKLFRVLVKEHGLEEKAMRCGIEFIVTGDGAEICGTNSASQTVVGFKLTDLDTKDPDTQVFMFRDAVGEDDDNAPLMYRGSQALSTCAPAAIALANESTEVLEDCFAKFFEFTRKLDDEGLEASGGEPAFARCTR